MRSRTAKLPSSVATVFSLALSLSFVSTANAATRVFYEDFDDPQTIDLDIWFKSNNCAKKVVGAADGASVHQGNCLRGNWKDSFTDPITKLTTAAGAAARYSGFNIHVKPAITTEMYLDYWAYVDPNAAKAYGCKWIWFEGTYKPAPDIYNQKFNHILLPPWKGWDTWRISANNTVGESGSSGNRTVLLSTLPGIQALKGDLSVDQWFQGRWHHFQVHMKLNTPASASNGVFRFWLDGVLVLDIDDYKFRDNDADLISHFSTPHMYGGGTPPPGSFGWQLDELAVWDGLPDESELDGGAGTAGNAGAGTGGSSAGSGGGAAGFGQAGGSGAGQGGGSGAAAGGSSVGGTGPSGDAASGSSGGGDRAGDDGGCSTSGAPHGSLAWLFAAVAAAIARSRRRRRGVPS